MLLLKVVLHTIRAPMDELDTSVNETDEETETQIRSDFSVCPTPLCSPPPVVVPYLTSVSVFVSVVLVFFPTREVG